MESTRKATIAAIPPVTAVLQPPAGPDMSLVGAHGPTSPMPDLPGAIEILVFY